MSDTKSQQEPSMEEILASIRRIISEDTEPAEPSKPEPAPAPAPVSAFAPPPPSAPSRWTRTCWNSLRWSRTTGRSWMSRMILERRAMDPEPEPEPEEEEPEPLSLETLDDLFDKPAPGRSPSTDMTTTISCRRRLRLPPAPLSRSLPPALAATASPEACMPMAAARRSRTS